MPLTRFGKFSLTFHLIGILFLGFFAQSAFAAPSEVSGEDIYKKNCAVCHGEQGDGMSRARHGLNPPPRDFTSPVAKSELTRERMLTSVMYGRPGTAMMPFSAKISVTTSRFLRLKPSSIQRRAIALWRSRLLSAGCGVDALRAATPSTRNNAGSSRRALRT